MKRILSVLLAVILGAGMTVAAFAANPKIAEQSKALPDVDAGECGPGHQIWLPLYAEYFNDAEEDLTMKDVRDNRITVRQNARRGSQAIASVDLKENKDKVASILITLADPFTSTKPMEFETRLELYFNGRRQNLVTVVNGELVNKMDEIYSDTDYIDLSNGITAFAVENARGVEAYLGHGVSVIVNMTRNREYYGTVTNIPDDNDIEVFDKHRDIEEALTLTTIGLNAEGKTVRIDAGRNYYVYSKNLSYLGRSNDMLPYSTKYYLSSKELDVDEGKPEDEYDPLDEPEYINEEEPLDEPEIYPGGDNPNDNPQSGGNRGSSHNPDTGIPPMSRIPVMGVILSLFTMTALSAYKKDS
ncbi:MAG: hypothetical protein FWG94_05575 [Oscillospiraceae bacterium]|nr:hypothetical protein [Oscillospiraceae bacterium]